MKRPGGEGFKVWSTSRAQERQGNMRKKKLCALRCKHCDRRPRPTLQNMRRGDDDDDDDDDVDVDVDVDSDSDSDDEGGDGKDDGDHECDDTALRSVFRHSSSPTLTQTTLLQINFRILGIFRPGTHQHFGTCILREITFSVFFKSKAREQMSSNTSFLALFPRVRVFISCFIVWFEIVSTRFITIHNRRSCHRDSIQTPVSLVVARVLASLQVFP